jgi:O-antigen biosynthesis protein
MNQLKGHIDGVDSGKVIGWAVKPSSPEIHQTLYIAVDGKSVTTTVASVYRKDLREAGFGTGCCSFSAPLHLPPEALIGKTISLLDCNGKPISHTEYIVPSIEHNLTIGLAALHHHQLIFNIHSAHLEVQHKELSLYFKSALISAQHVDINNGLNCIVFSLPANLSRNSYGHFSLFLSGYPVMIWQEYLYLTLLPGERVATTAIEQQASRSKDEFACLMQTVDGFTAEEALHTIAAYVVSKGHKSLPISLPKVSNPEFTILVCAELDSKKLKRLIANLLVTIQDHRFEIICFSASANDLKDITHLNIINVDKVNATAVISALDNITSPITVICPDDIEFHPGVIDGLVSQLNHAHIGFCANKLADSNGYLIDNTSKRKSPISLANHPQHCYTQSTPLAVNQCVAYRTVDLKKIEVDLKTTQTRKQLFAHWQQHLNQTNTVGAIRGTQTTTLLSEKNRMVEEALSSIDRHPSPSRSIVTGKPLCGTIVMLDMQLPRPDNDAGSYAAVQEMKLMQSLGYHIIFIALDFCYQEKYSQYLQDLGIEVCYAPFYPSPAEALSHCVEKANAVYITRYHVASQYIDYLNTTYPELPVIFNNADLHFLREIRSALTMPKNTEQEIAVRKKALHQATITQQQEIDVMVKVDAILSYNPIEHAVITSHIHEQDKIFHCPWVLEQKPKAKPYDTREGIAFLGGYKHTPNREAIEYFFTEIFSDLIAAHPEINIYLYGSNMPPEFEKYQHPNVNLIGYVENLDDVFLQHRLFIAPLLSGAGIKGKVLEAAAYGLPSVLSPIAAEATGLQNNISALIAETPTQWVDAIINLYHNEPQWNQLSQNATILAQEEYSFEKGQDKLKKVFHFLNLETH